MIGVWHYDEFWIYQGSRYARVTHGSEQNFSIIDIWQGFEYVSSSEYASVTQGSVENGLWIWQSYTEFCVKGSLKIHGVSNVLSTEYAKVWMYQESKYAIVTKSSE